MRRYKCEDRFVSLDLCCFCCRYKWIIAFPTFATCAIYADYSHTRRYKAEKALSVKTDDGTGLSPKVRRLWVAIIPATGVAIGYYYDEKERLRMTSFRGKSKLFGREMSPGERPPWP